MAAHSRQGRCTDKQKAKDNKEVATPVVEIDNKISDEGEWTTAEEVLPRSRVGLRMSASSSKRTHGYATW